MRLKMYRAVQTVTSTAGGAEGEGRDTGPVGRGGNGGWGDDLCDTAAGPGHGAVGTKHEENRVPARPDVWCGWRETVFHT